jgi:hypothetical protein
LLTHGTFAKLYWISLGGVCTNATLGRPFADVVVVGGGVVVGEVVVGLGLGEGLSDGDGDGDGDSVGESEGLGDADGDSVGAGAGGLSPDGRATMVPGQPRASPPPSRSSPFTVTPRLRRRPG